MDPDTAAFWIGVAFVIVTFCWIAYVSIVGEALRGYALSYLFELIPETDERTQRKFEVLTRRDDEFIQVAEIGRIIGFVLHVAGWATIMMPLGTKFELDYLLFVGAMAIMSLVLCVIIVPPLILRHREEQALLVLLPSFAWIALPFKPLTAIGGIFRRMGARIEGVDADDTPEESFEDELADSLEGAEREGLLDEDEREMINAVVELGKTPASRAMIPRTDMVCADLTDGIDGAVKLAVQHGHSRIPVYDGDRDHIVGIFNTRDLVPTWKQAADVPVLELRKIVRPAKFFPDTKPLDDLLREMRDDRAKIAILTDEHGGTAGMITLEDILEEIVGDIRDEYDAGEVERAHRAILPFRNNEAEADGDVDLDEVNAQLEIDLPEGVDYNSLGGLILHRLGRLATKGDEVIVGALNLKVIEADERRIKRVAIQRVPDEAGVTGEERKE